MEETGLPGERERESQRCVMVVSCLALGIKVSSSTVRTWQSKYQLCFASSFHCSKGRRFPRNKGQGEH